MMMERSRVIVVPDRTIAKLFFFRRITRLGPMRKYTDISTMNVR